MSAKVSALKDVRKAQSLEVSDGGRQVATRRPAAKAPAPRSDRGNRVIFLLVVALPTLAMLLYSLLTPSPIYRTEVAFAVRSSGPSGGAEALGGLAASFGIGGGANNDIFAIRSYLRSASTLEALDERTDFLAHVSDETRDPLTRLDADATADDRLAYYRDFVSVDVSINEQIVTVYAKAYTPQMAVEIAQVLVALSEAFVNELNRRAEEDLVAFARGELDSSRQAVTDARIAITEWRNETNEVDPSKSIDAQLGVIAGLEGELAGVRTELIRLAGATVAPREREFRNREAALVEQIGRERERLVGQRSQMAGLLSEYERLTIERDMSEELYKAATEALTIARQEAQRQQKYIVVTSEPALTEEPVFPRPVFHTTMALLGGMTAYLIIVFIRALARDYRETSVT